MAITTPEMERSERAGQKQTSKTFFLVISAARSLTSSNFHYKSNIYDRQVFKKAKQISNDHTHFLSPAYVLLPSKKHFSSPECTTNKRQFSFIPASNCLLNGSAKESDFLVCVCVCVCVCM